MVNDDDNEATNDRAIRTPGDAMAGGSMEGGNPRPGRRRAPIDETTIPQWSPCELPVEIAWGEVWRDAGPIEIEIGCGSGGYLVEAAAREPERRFVGIDYAGKFLARTRRKCARANLHNVLLYYGTAEELLPQVPAGSVAAVDIFFPDPWHKDRHAKRRGVRAEMLQWIFEALAPVTGELRLRTDVEPYFEEMREVVAMFARGLEVVDEVIYHDAPPTADWICTDWERRFLGEGLTCHALTARRRAELLPA
jgi:tRNA (guanine-N7-)-methyltransferase